MARFGEGARHPSAVALVIGLDDADALALHAVIINVGLGLLLSATMLAFGEPIYRFLGGNGGEIVTDDPQAITGRPPADRAKGEPLAARLAEPQRCIKSAPSRACSFALEQRR